MARQRSTVFESSGLTDSSAKHTNGFIQPSKAHGTVASSGQQHQEQNKKETQKKSQAHYVYPSSRLEYSTFANKTATA